MPVGSLMRPAPLIEVGSSLEVAAHSLRESGASILVVVDENRLVGGVTEATLALALADGAEMTDPVERGMDIVPSIAPYSTGAEALRVSVEDRAASLVVIDDLGRVMGLISPSDLYPKFRRPLRPYAVGGMATPFGVYLTTGYIGAGVSKWALYATGVLMFWLIAIALVSGVQLDKYLLSLHLPPEWVDPASWAFSALVFVLLLRINPLTGYHGAEHQVVHAIERGEELDPKIVARMPRVHPRCGTNLAVSAGLFLGIFMTRGWAPDEIRLLVAVLLTMGLRKPLGAFAQQYGTTKRPSPKQLAAGIRSGKQLLEAYASTRNSAPNFAQRMLSSGMLHVMAGSLSMAGLVYVLGLIFHVDTI